MGPTESKALRNELKKAIKRINERIARTAKTYGRDSEAYKSMIELVRNSLSSVLQNFSYTSSTDLGDVLHTFIKTTSTGNIAIDSTVKTLDYIISLGKDLEIDQIDDKTAEKITSQLDRVKASIEVEHELGTSYEEDWQEIKERIRAYNAVREGVRNYLDNMSKEDSDKLRTYLDGIKDDERPASYWELYRAICEAHDLEWRDIYGTTTTMKHMKLNRTSKKDRKSSIDTASKIRSEKGVEIGAGQKYSQPSWRNKTFVSNPRKH